MDEKRQFERKFFREEVHFTVSVLDFMELKKLELKGIGIDISNTGLGMRTDYPLEPGHVLRFSNGIAKKSGLVRWSEKTEDRYRIGIQFV